MCMLCARFTVIVRRAPVKTSNSSCTEHFTFKYHSGAHSQLGGPQPPPLSFPHRFTTCLHFVLQFQCSFIGGNQMQPSTTKPKTNPVFVFIIGVPLENTSTNAQPTCKHHTKIPKHNNNTRNEFKTHLHHTTPQP